MSYLLFWTAMTGIRAGSSEMLGAPRPYTTPCGLLKQPDKQKVFSPGICCRRRMDNRGNVLERPRWLVPNQAGSG